MRITFLGTSSSRPTVRRNVSSIAVQREGEMFLFDCGEGTQRQMMRYGVGFGVREIFISHLHADHYLGLPGLLRTMSLQGREDELVVWGGDETEATLRAAIDLGGDRLQFPVAVRELPGGEAVRYDGFEIRAFPVEHTMGSVGLALVEDDRLGRFDAEAARMAGVEEGPDFGRLHRGEDVRVESGEVVAAADVVGPTRPGRTLVFSGDTRPCDSTVEVARGADLLIHEATFSDAEAGRARETRHSTATEAAMLARQAEVRKLVLTHFSARYSEQAYRLLKEAEVVYPALAAEDGLSLEVPLADEPVGEASD
ncbi:MAG: ribonuclease Z [Gemmatimonadetes bacterium]|nr:ribonuclease Z [Gemmatimonadota bacterium]